MVYYITRTPNKLIHQITQIIGGILSIKCSFRQFIVKITIWAPLLFLGYSETLKHMTLEFVDKL